jgi:hypothetical protein
MRDGYLLGIGGLMRLFFYCIIFLEYDVIYTHSGEKTMGMSETTGTLPKWPHPTITWYSHTLTRYHNNCIAHICQLPAR